MNFITLYVININTELNLNRELHGTILIGNGNSKCYGNLFSGNIVPVIGDVIVYK